MRLQENFNEFQVAIIDQTLTKMTNTDSKGICFLFYFINTLASMGLDRK